MFCKKCGTNINEGAGFCPKCGEPVGSDNQNQVIPPVSALWDMYSPNGQPVNGQTANAQGAQPGNGQPVNMQYTNTQQNGFTKGFTMEGTGGFQKFVKGHKALLITGTVVLVVLLLVLCNLSVLANFVRRTFSSPEAYYHYVEKKTVEQLSADAGEIYGRYFLDNLDVSDRSVSARMSVTLDEGGQDLMSLAGIAGLDMTWLESMSFAVDSSTKKDAISMGLGVAINGVDVLTGNVVCGLDDETVYLQVPELNQKYIGVEIPDSGFEDMGDVWEMYEMLARICPDQKEMEKLLNRYLMTAVESMDDVEKDKETLEAEDIEQKCTVLTVTADKNTLKDMTINLLRQMRDDKEIEKIIKTAMEEETFVEELYLDDMTADEAYEEFQEEIDSTIEELEDLGRLDVYDDETLEMKVYVDKKGKIVGRIFEMGDVTVKMLMPEKGKKFGYELSYEDSYFEESAALTGSGQRSGDKIEGEFVLEAYDTSIMNIGVKDLNTKDMRRGMMNGSMTLSLSKGVEDIMGYAPGMSMLQGMELSMDFESDKNSGSCKMGVSVRDKALAHVDISYKKEKGYKGKDPGKNVVMIEDVDDLAEWGRDFDLSGLTSSLKTAGVPSEITDSLEMYEDVDMESVIRMLMYYGY